MNYSKVVNLEVNKIKKWDINPRVIDKKQMEKLKDKINRYPFFLEQRPILVSEQNGEYVVFAGNQRLEAARQLGWKEVPVVVFTDIEERVKKDLSIIDNKNDGEWDFSKLALNFKTVDFKSLGIDFNFETPKIEETNFVEPIIETQNRTCEIRVDDEEDEDNKDDEYENNDKQENHLKNEVQCPFCKKKFNV